MEEEEKGRKKERSFGGQRRKEERRGWYGCALRKQGEKGSALFIKPSIYCLWGALAASGMI